MSNSNDHINTDFNLCPIGREHELEIQHTKDILNMAIERLEYKMDDMREDLETLNNSVNERFDRVDSKFETVEAQIDKLNASLPSRIDERIAANTINKKANVTDKVLSIILGVISTVCGGIALVAAKLVLNL